MESETLKRADKPLWVPDAAAVAGSNMRAFMDHVAARYGVAMGDYGDLHHWSVTARENFGARSGIFAG